jgi:hypothetical protein
MAVDADIGIYLVFETGKPLLYEGDGILSSGNLQKMEMHRLFLTTLCF